MGAVLRTLTIRLFAEQIEFIANDADDKVIFVDADLVPVLDKLAGKLPTVRQFVGVATAAEPTRLAPTFDYEALLASNAPRYAWPVLDENSAAAMCYTSGTTGNPKGVVYSHRSSFLHSMGICMADNFGVSERDVVLPVVPMFHANAWGLPYATTLAGAKHVLPGRFLGGQQLVEMVEQERVSILAGVPSIWIGLASYLERVSLEPIQPDLSSVRLVPCGGSGLPPALMPTIGRLRPPLLHGLGLTGTSPLPAVSRVKPTRRPPSGGERVKTRRK